MTTTVTTASKYPHSQKAVFCQVYLETPCPSYPCRHVPYHNKDWLEDVEEWYSNRDKNHLLWEAFRSPERFERRMPSDVWEEFLAKFPRCQRIDESREEINLLVQDFLDSPLGDLKSGWNEVPGFVIRHIRSGYPYFNGTPGYMTQQKEIAKSRWNSIRNTGIVYDVASISEEGMKVQEIDLGFECARTFLGELLTLELMLNSGESE